ncbi:hypothetical protein PO909_011474 [Leuciscus waleckii]
MMHVRMKWTRIWNRWEVSSVTYATWLSTWATRSTPRTVKSTGLWTRLIPTKPGLTKPTSAPQKCWEVAKSIQEVLCLIFPLPTVPATVHMCFYHGTHLTGLHTCTYHPLNALSRKCRCVSVLTDSLVNGHIYSVSFSPKVKCT